MSYPKIYLSIDNCFASKRWTHPEDFIHIIKACGISYVEISADTECDPLYMGLPYLESFGFDLKAALKKEDVKASCVYSGHGTYATLGLAHTDSRVADRLQNEWVKPMMDLASTLESNIGFYCHAFDNRILQSPDRYRNTKKELLRRFSELSDYWKQKGTGTHMAVEQMYTPNQYPFTIRSALDMISTLRDVYLTVDTGHQCGQNRFYAPTESAVCAFFKNSHAPVWLGLDRCYEYAAAVRSGELPQADALREIRALVRQTPYLFSEKQDSDTYAWLRTLGPYSPVIHLQQTDGHSSGHRSFTRRNNDAGIIDAFRVIEALYEGYKAEEAAGLPPRCEKLYLTLELFFPTSSYSNEITEEIKESVSYWRQVIPEDGIALDEAYSLV